MSKLRTRRPPRTLWLDELDGQEPEVQVKMHKPADNGGTMVTTIWVALALAKRGPYEDGWEIVEVYSNQRRGRQKPEAKIWGGV